MAPWRTWSVFLLCVATALLAVAIPAWLIQPFRHQTPFDLSFSYFLKQWSPWAVPLLAGIACLAAVRLWFAATEFSKRAGITLALAIALVAAWFARQNHFEWMFRPPDGPAYVEAARASFLSDQDRVLGVSIQGEAVAYPIRALAYHHLVHDRVGGVDLVATY